MFALSGLNHASLTRGQYREAFSSNHRRPPGLVRHLGSGERLGRFEAQALLQLRSPGRLRQLDLQSRGPAAFDDPQVQTALGGVTDEQRKKWAGAKDEYDRKAGKVRREAGGVDTVRRIPGTDLPALGQEVVGDETLLQLRREHALAAKLVLTTDQLNTWYELIGDVYPNPEKKRK